MLAEAPAAESGLVTVFATPEPTWTAMVAALDEDPSDEAWALKLAVQCRDHLRHSLGPADAPGVSVSAWNRDPGAQSPQRTEGPGKSRRTAKDTAGGPSGPSGAFLRWHVLLGALIAKEFEDAGREAPAWTRTLRRLDQEWVVPAKAMSENQVRNNAPDWLVQRGIYISKLDLALV